MKKILTYFILILFVFSSGAVLAGQGRGHDKQKRGSQFERDQRHVRDYRSQHPQQHHRQDRHWPGYRDRYRGHRDYHPHGYKGHWNSWNDWHHYYKQHRREFRHPRYYRHNGSLYFEFETNDGRFAFSIGR